MAHSTHKLKAYISDYKRLVFCELCGREEDEGLDDPCSKKFYVERVDHIHSQRYVGFVSGLPDLI